MVSALHRFRPGLLGFIAAAGIVACSQSKDSGTKLPTDVFSSGGIGGGGGLDGSGGAVDTLGGRMSSGGAMLSFSGAANCVSKTCKELNYACGSFQNECGTITDCANEGLKCSPLEACLGGVDGPTTCTSTIGPCAVCASVPNCTAAGTTTHLTGRVITPGRTDADTANQVGVPNAVVYIMRSNDVADLPAIDSGIPMGGTSCDRCKDQNLGSLLVGGVTDATGHFDLKGTIPVGSEFTLVVKAGRFRRAAKYTLPASAACQTTALPEALPDNPARLPRAMDDGLAANIPMTAVATGKIDAMECVLEKMGIAHKEFGNPGGTQRVQLYRGGVRATGGIGPGPGPGMGMGGAAGVGGAAGTAGAANNTYKGSGAVIDANTPRTTALYSDLATLQKYDILIADCEGDQWDQDHTQRDAYGDKLREYLNRGGRMFASHLEFSWLLDNGTQAFDATNPIGTGLASAATWSTMIDSTTASGTGLVSVGLPGASPRIQNFADWMANEKITTPPANTFPVKEPRSAAAAIGPSSEEFVRLQDMGGRTQQFSFNTPYSAPDEAACGRVAYSGFHVSIGDTTNAVFPNHCTGDLTAQEKVLLYMLFDLGACVGEIPPPPECVPNTCENAHAKCGYLADGCGNVLDCGVCPPPK